MPRRGGGGARRVRRTRRRRRRRRILLVGGLVAFGTYKMTTKDANRVKEHTGTDPEELTDEELAQAMDQLGIDKQQVTAADKEIAASGDATTTSGDATTPAAATGGAGYMDELQKLADLNKAGVLTDEEFAAKKAQILGL